MANEKELEKNSSSEDNDEQENIINEKPSRKCFLHSALMPFLFWLIFAGLFYFFAYDLANIKYSDITDVRVIKFFSSYSVYAGLALGFISMLGGYLLLLILKITKLKKVVFSYPILAALMTLPWYLFARQLVYFENKYTDIAKALIYYIGEPLLSSTKFMLWLIFIWLLILIVKKLIGKGLAKKGGLIVFVFILPLFLTGCWGNMQMLACPYFDDQDHCYQNAAIQNGDPDGCEKIKGADFESSGSNPPRDKCYLQIAENTGDLGVCEKIEGGPYSYTKEECILNTSVKFKDPSGCAMLSGAEKSDCLTKVSPHIYPGSVIEIDDQIALLKEELEKNPDEGLQKQLEGLEKKKSDYLEAMTDNNKNEYASLSDPMNKKVALEYHLGEIDEKTKNSLTALNDSLRQKGEKLTEKEYNSLRDMLAYKNDPKNNIENMDDAEIVKLRWNEKFASAAEKIKFWKANPSEAEKKLDEQLLFYQRMLERKQAIEKGFDEKQQDFERNADMVKDYIKSQVSDAVVDEAKKIAFGELLDLVDSPASAPVTAILGEAIDVVKSEAQSKEFRGLVRAYNLGMEEELSKAGGDLDKAHQAVIANLQNNPYEYEDQNTFAKYGNILENKDCDGTNPHCVNKEVFWKAMKKSYKYQNK